MNSATRLIKHNPAFLTPEELERTFVVRISDLETILRVVRENVGPVNQHLLVVGPRGMGKTMLVRRVSQAVERDAELSRRWLPVLVAEEKYNVASEGELWLETLRYVSKTKVGDPERWKAAYERLLKEQDPERVREAALARLRELAQQEGRRLLIVLENVNMIFSDQSEGDMGWDLRKTLLAEPHIMLLATATSRFDQIDHADKPMYELFHELKLQPLTTDECRVLWKSVAQQDLEGPRIRPMEILTGGNPRLLAILAGFSFDRSFRELMDNLIVLVDDHTAYLKANIEVLPPQERRVFVTLAEIWEPTGAAEVAARARMDVNKTSEYLRRLVDRGAVEQKRNPRKKGRKLFYQVAERLYNIYHLMRESSSQSERVHAVVDFMVRFYNPQEAVRIISTEAPGVPPGERAPLIEAYRSILSRFGTGEADWENLVSAAPDDFYRLPETKQYASMLAALRDARNQNEKAREHFEKKEFETALSVLDEIVKNRGEQDEWPLARQIALALFDKGLTLGELNRREEGIAVYDEIVRRYGEREDLPLAEPVARALFNKGYSLRELNRLEEGIAVYDEIVRRFGERQELPLADPVARALFNKGNSLWELNRLEEGIAVYDEIVRRFGERQELPLAEQVAKVLLNKGFSLGKLNRREEGIAVYDEIVRRYGERHEVPLAEQVAMALFNKGNSLRELNRLEEGIAVYDEIVRRYRERQEVPLAEQVVKALFNKSVTLWKSGHLPEGVETAILALKRSEKFKELRSAVLEVLTDFLILLASSRSESEMLETIRDSGVTHELDPLVVALQMLKGEEPTAPQEVVEVAKDVVERIKSLRKEKAPEKPADNKTV